VFHVSENDEGQRVHDLEEALTGDFVKKMEHTNITHFLSMSEDARKSLEEQKKKAFQRQFKPV
jgi:hypothetical protein